MSDYGILTLDQAGQEMKGLKFLRAWRVFVYAALAINIGAFVLDVLTGSSLLAIVNGIMIIALIPTICLHTRNIHRREELDRPRPDYSAIARMERDLYGETFKHEGAVEPARPPIRSGHDHNASCLTSGCPGDGPSPAAWQAFSSGFGAPDRPR